MGMRENYRVLVLYFDGPNVGIFNNELYQVRMPHLERNVMDREFITVRNAVTVSPSSTQEAGQAASTGSFPFMGGAITYKKKTRRIKDLTRLEHFSKGNTAKRDTVFRDFPDEAYSVLFPWNDHADDKHAYSTSIAQVHLLKGRRGMDDFATARVVDIIRNEDPKLIFAWFPTGDYYGHRHSDTEKLAKVYIKDDRRIGKIVNALKENGRYDDTVIVVVSDHSMAPVHDNMNPNEILREAGFNPMIWRTRNGDPDSLFLSYGYSVGQVYLLRDHSESELEGKIHALLNNNAIDQVISKNGNGTRRVFSRMGTADIVKKRGLYRMIQLTSSNPFGYPDNLAEKLAQWHTSRESLDWTCEQQYPDAVVGIAESLNHELSPDLRIFAADGYDFGKNRNLIHPFALFNADRVGTHGSLHSSQSRIMMMFAGPDELPRKEVKAARLVDLRPTLADIAGYKVPENIDGISLFGGRNQ